ncbi:hypothetical protein QUB56_05110 [Microcoleus sp. AR_TQ3_B6]|uniref:hypothetical protein n=1 Tax=Microcoleus sp. AR_TQ3_B6 TaxID=3055284 RepID=UPI002FD34E9A
MTNFYIQGNTSGVSISLMLNELFNSDKLEPGHKIFCVVPKSCYFTTAYMMLTYRYLMTANNLDKPAFTQRIIYINPVCDRIEKMYIGIVRLVGAGLSDYSFPT